MLVLVQAALPMRGWAQVGASGPGNAVAFNGVDNYISAYGSDYGGEDFCIELWVKIPAFTRDSQPIITKGYDSWRIQRRGTTGYIEYVETTENYPPVSPEPVTRSISSTVKVDDGLWHHVAVTRHWRFGLFFFVDGRLQDDQPALPERNLRDNNYDLRIGGNPLMPQSGFYGYIDEVRFWTNSDYYYYRDEATIRNDMNRSLSGRETDLHSYWRFDETSGSVAQNAVSGSPAAVLSVGVTRTASDVPLMKPQTLLPAGTPLDARNLTWNRRNADGTRSGLYTPYRTFRFYPGGTGPHRISMNTAGFSGAVYLYQGGFNPCSTLANIYSPASIASSSGWVAYDAFLAPGTYYEIVFSAADPGASGTFEGIIESLQTIMPLDTSTNMHVICGPTDRTIVTGTSTTLEVHTGGPPPSGYQWYAGTAPDTTRPIAGATQSSYTTPTLFASTNYWVRVFAGPGASPAQVNSGTATITIVAAPVARFTNVLDASDCRLNDGKMFETVRFRIQEEGNYYFTNSGGGTFQVYEGYFDPAQPELNKWGALNGFYPDGDFEVVVSKATPGTNTGSIGGGPAVVVLLPPLPPQILSSPLDTTIRPGQRATLTVSTTCGGTPRTLQWYEGNSGDTNKPAVGARAESFQTPPLTNETRYWVRMESAVNTNDSATAIVYVTDGPITAQGELVECDHAFRRPTAPGVLSDWQHYYKTFVFRAAQGGQYTFTLNATNFSGAMALYDQIFSTNNPLLNLYQISQTNGSVATLTTTLLGGAGRFYLVITSENPNEIGTFSVRADGPAFVTKSAAPTISNQPPPFTLTGLGTNVTLCVGSDSVGVWYQWYVGDENCSSRVPIPGANSNCYTTLAVTNVLTYWAEVINAGGYVFSQPAQVAPMVAALDDTFTIASGGGICAPGVLLNDRGSGNPLTATLASQATNGMVTLNPDGSFIYIATAGFTGEDSFTYQVSDGISTSLPATVHLFVVAPVPTVYLNGPGNALKFDGTNGIVQLNGGGGFHLTKGFTIEAWFKLDANWDDAYEALITKGDTAWRVQRYQQTSFLTFDTTGLTPMALPGKTAIQSNRWYHVAAVFDGLHKYLYLNGQLDASNSVTGLLGTNAYPVEIAANAQMSGRFFGGEMDEIRIWDQARCQVDIAADMSRPLTGFEPALIAYLRADESEGIRLTDHAPAGGDNYGTLVGGVTRSKSTVEPFTPTVSTLPAIAYEPMAWLNSFVNDHTLPATAWFEWGTDTNYVNVTPAANAKNVFCQIASGVQSGATYCVRAWAQNASGTSVGSNVTFVAGAPTKLLPPQRLADGSASVRWSNPAGSSLGLLASTNLINWESVGMPTNSGSIYELIDRDAPYHPHRFYKLQEQQHWLAFDGTNDYVLASAMSLSNTSFTIEARIQRATSNRWDIFFMQGTNQNGRGLHVGFRPNNFFTLGFWGDDLDYSVPFTDTNWHHWAVTYNATNRLRRIYLDGNLVAEGVSASQFQGNGPITFGWAPPLSAFFQGGLDDVRIWTVARTTEEIQSTLTAPLPSNTDGLAAEYRFDEGSGTNTFSTTGSAATLLGGTAWKP